MSIGRNTETLFCTANRLHFIYCNELYIHIFGPDIIVQRQFYILEVCVGNM
jgi:hypothetical protein